MFLSVRITIPIFERAGARPNPVRRCAGRPSWDHHGCRFIPTWSSTDKVTYRLAFPLSPAVSCARFMALTLLMENITSITGCPGPVNGGLWSMGTQNHVLNLFQSHPCDHANKLQETIQI